MEAMREKGDGTITWRKDRRRWQVAVTFETGRVYRYVKGPPPPERRTKAIERYAPAEAREELDRLLRLRAAEIDVPGSRLTLEAWLHRWIDSLDRGGRVRPATLRFYRMIAREHIIPELGRFTLPKLTVGRVQAWVDGMGGSPRSIAHRRDVLRAALSVAERRQLVDRNVAKLVDLPAVAKAEPPVLTADRARVLLEGTAETWYGPLWAFLLASGCRIAEALGTIWDDVDLADASVHIDRQLAQDGVDVLPSGRRVARWVRVPVKAARKVERIALPPFAVESLRRHRVRMAEARTAEWTHWGHVFVTANGRPPQETFIVKLLERELARLGLPKVTVHQLRHSNATLLREADVDEQTRMDRLGHNTTTMARRYAHAVDQDDRDAAAGLQRLIGGGA
jgi:integrase